MSIFDRQFADITNQQPTRIWTENEGIRALFEHWYLPGTQPPSGSATPCLRIGIRNGYINLYTNGQSVAKLTVSRGGQSAKAEVHWKYATGVEWRERKLPQEEKPAGTADYWSFGTASPSSPITPDDVSKWIETATTYRSSEKTFVERLVAANPGVIDLEMGLPAKPGEKTAPRMDLVVVQDTGMRAQIAFWEAKCNNNGELRAKAPFEEAKSPDDKDLGPHVISQVLKYQRWLGKPDGSDAAQVAAAYQRAAEILLWLADTFDKAECEATRLWRLAAQGPEIVTAPGIVIADYEACPKANAKASSTGKDPFAARRDSFPSHRRKLVDGHGITVQQFECADDHVLPRLEEKEIRSKANTSGAQN